MKNKETPDNALRELLSIFKNQNTNPITIEKKYLPEVFSRNILEISKTDGLPIIKSDILNYFKKKGIITRFNITGIQFENVFFEIFDFIDRIKEFEEDIIVIGLEDPIQIQDIISKRKKKLYRELKENIDQLSLLKNEIDSLTEKKKELNQQLEKFMNEKTNLSFLRNSYLRLEPSIKLLLSDLQERINKHHSLIEKINSSDSNS